MVQYRIEIDRDICIGDGLCCEAAPATFAVDEEFKVLVRDPTGDTDADIYTAARSCPLDVISLFDVATDMKVWPRTA